MSVIDFFTRRASDSPGSRSPREADISLAFLGAIVESSDDAIVGTTLDGHIIAWNAPAPRRYGHQAADVIGRPAEILIPRERRDEERGIFEKVRRGERVEHFETTRLTRDGEPLTVSLSVSPVL